MVLIRTLCALVILAAGVGCGQSLFDANGARHRDGGTGGDDDGGGDDGGPDAMVPEKCEAPCIADAASDFIDTAGTAWRYLDDRRNRIWVPMAQSGDGRAMMSLNLSNRFARCSDEMTAAACQEMPDALLVTAAGMQSSADPAIELQSAATQPIQLVFRVHVPSTGSPSYKVRLYRNSREDVLLTTTVAPGTTARRAIYVDALASDRFLVALEPMGSPGGSVALHFFARGPDPSFPATCQLAIPFPSAGTSATPIPNLCGEELRPMNSSMPSPLFLDAGPFVTQGKSGHFEPSYHVEGTQPLSRGNDMTIQLWVQHDYPADPRVWLFSDIDQVAGGGLGISITSDGSTNRLEVSVPSAGDPAVYTNQSVAYPNAAEWHLVRVIHASNTVTICVDGRRQASAILPGPTPSVRPPYLGKNVIWPPLEYFRGAIDDVRVFSGALPCEP